MLEKATPDEQIIVCCANCIPKKYRVKIAVRITAENSVSREAQAYNEFPHVISFFPSGAGQAQGSVIEIEDPDILLSSVKKTENGYMLRLYNSSDCEKDTTVGLTYKGEVLKLHFGPHEIKHIELY